MQPHERTLSRTLEVIDQVGREQPYCAVCGRPNHPVARGDVIWLECQSWTDRTSRLARFISFNAGHTRHQLVDELVATPLTETE